MSPRVSEGLLSVPAGNVNWFRVSCKSDLQRIVIELDMWGFILCSLEADRWDPGANKKESLGEKLLFPFWELFP